MLEICFLPGESVDDSIQETACYYHEEEVLYLQPMIPLNVLTFPPPDCGGCSEGLDAFRFFFQTPLYVNH